MDKEVIWIVRGSQRKGLFLQLPENPFISNKLRKEINEKTGSNLSLREMSRHLNDFQEYGLIKCLNPSDPYNKIYELTQKGKSIIKTVKDI